MKAKLFFIFLRVITGLLIISCISCKKKENAPDHQEKLSEQKLSEERLSEEEKAIFPIEDLTYGEIEEFLPYYLADLKNNMSKPDDISGLDALITSLGTLAGDLAREEPNYTPTRVEAFEQKDKELRVGVLKAFGALDPSIRKKFEAEKKNSKAKAKAKRNAKKSLLDAIRGDDQEALKKALIGQKLEKGSEHYLAKEAVKGDKAKSLEYMISQGWVDLNKKDKEGNLLHLAKNSPAAIKTLIEKKPNEVKKWVNELNAEKNSPLAEAIKSDNEEVLKALMEIEGIKLDQTKSKALNKQHNDIREIPLLHKAAENGSENAFKMLLEKDPASFEKNDIADNTVLETAAKNGHANILKILNNSAIDKKVLNKVGNQKTHGRNSLLHNAINSGSLETVKEVEELAQAADLKLNNFNHDGFTPFLSAVYQGHTDIVDHMLAKNPQLLDTKVSDFQSGETGMIAAKEGDSAMHVAARRNRHEIMSLVCRKNKDACYKLNDEGLFVADVAAELGHRESLELLYAIDSGVFNWLNGNGFAPIWSLAAGNEKTNNKELAEYLLERSSAEAINACGTKKGELPALHQAIFSEKDQVVAAFIGKGKAKTNLGLKCPNNKTPIHVFAQRQKNGDVHESIIEFIKALPSELINAQDENKKCPLHWAVSLGNVDTLAALVSNDHIDTNLADNNNLTPLESLLEMELQTNADENSPPKRGGNKWDEKYANKNALFKATLDRRTEMADFLLAVKSSKLNKRDGKENSPLMLATERHMHNIMQYLVDDGAPLNETIAIDGKTQNALVYAAIKDALDKDALSQATSNYSNSSVQLSTENINSTLQKLKDLGLPAKAFSEEIFVSKEWPFKDVQKKLQELSK
jgi:ankyrin repeat protein